MRILQVTVFLTPRRGGTSTFPCRLSEELVSRGHSVTILTSDFEMDEAYVKDIRSEGVRVVPFHSIASFGLYIISPSMKRWLKENLRDYDVVHLHSLRSYQNAQIMRYAGRIGVPMILQAHGSIKTLNEKRALKKLFDLFWGNRILRNSSRFIALTNTEQEDYERVGVDPSKISIVPVGVDLPGGETLQRRGAFRRVHGIGTDEKVILYVGRIHGTKGLDLLIGVYADILSQFPRSRLIFIGPDDGHKDNLLRLADSLNLKIPDNLSFLGFVTEQEKFDALTDADVFVTPRFHGFPATFLESMACGTPIVTTDDGDLVEWIDGTAGYVVKFDRIMMRDAIIRILENEPLRNELGRKGREQVMREHGWGTITPQFERTYRQCVRRTS